MGTRLKAPVQPYLKGIGFRSSLGLLLPMIVGVLLLRMLFGWKAISRLRRLITAPAARRKSIEYHALRHDADLRQHVRGKECAGRAGIHQHVGNLDLSVAIGDADCNEQEVGAQR